MRKFLTLEKINCIIIFGFLFFALSFSISYFLKFNLLLYLSGFFLAVYVPGLALANLFDKENDWLKKILISPIFTVFMFIPAYYMLTILFKGTINLYTAFFSVLILSLISILLTYKKSQKKEEDTEDKKFLYFGIIIFLVVHFLTITAYKFIPEVDGYTDLMRIENILSSNFFNLSYRPLFSLLVSYVSLISQVPPYWIFKFGLAIIQTSGLYYLYQIIKTSGLKSNFAKYLVLLAFVSVPIINLEIDYIRPNVIFIFAILPFVYYLSKGIEGKKINFIFSSAIAILGLLFHEFFGILFVVNLIFIAKYFFKNFSSYKKSLAISAAAIFFLILLLNASKSSTLVLFLNTIANFIKLVTHGLHWDWWFLNSYINMSGDDLGWSGPLNIFKYYAYSLSPALVLVFLAYLFYLCKKIKNRELFFSTEKISLAILFIGLFFAEFLPRINYPTLPDRFWPLISISLISLMPFILSEIKLFSKKIILILLLCLLIIGISGSVYIAKEKGGYVSEREYNSAQWIKKNTPENSLFITQGENVVIFNYFAKRENITPYNSFFLDESALKIKKENFIESEAVYKNIITLFNEALERPNDDNLDLLAKNLKDYYKKRGREKLTKNIENADFILPKNENIYVYYSMDKFNNYYGQRQWWKDANFYGANLNKFNDGYDLVYNDSDIIYIWKKK